MNQVSLYFHVPFCSKKCGYCHFFVLPDKPDLKKQYMESLRKEWNMHFPRLAGKEIVSIYFGGGTPALLGAVSIQTILDWIASGPATLSPLLEITLEANPENITLELMRDYALAGVNRASIGVQTFDDAILHGLGRTHGAQKAIDAVQATFEAGIENISIDLMYDLPSQDLALWKKTLQIASALPISHLSLYNLTIEPHTAFFKHRTTLQPLIPDEETSLLMYEEAICQLEKAGLKQYEISAFARNGQISKHNVGYWTARPFLGLGPSAFSYWEGHRFRNIAHLNKYSQRLNEGISPVDFDEQLDEEAKSKELLAIRLRLKEGIDLDDFQFNHSPLSPGTIKSLFKLEQDGFLTNHQSRITLTHRGILFYDTVAEELV